MRGLASDSRRPILLMNATNALTGEPFIISDEAFRSMSLPLAPSVLPEPSICLQPIQACWSRWPFRMEEPELRLNGIGETSHFWHIALRQLSDSDPPGARVAGIKTNLGLSAEDQVSLVAAAARLIAQGREGMTRTASWAGFIASPPARFSNP